MSEARKPLFGCIRASLLFRVVVVYFGASWIVLEIVDTFGEQFGLPTWFFPTAFALLLIVTISYRGEPVAEARRAEGKAASDRPGARRARAFFFG